MQTGDKKKQNFLSFQCDPVFLFLILLTAGAFFLRFQYVLHTTLKDPLHSDALQYYWYGYNLAFHGTFSNQSTEAIANLVPDAFRSPGYPLLIALFISLCGPIKFYTPLLVAQALLSALLTPLTYLLGRHFLPRWGAITAALLIALSPHLVAMVKYLLTETLFAFLLLITLIAFLRGTNGKRHQTTYLAIAGFLAGCSYLTNEAFLFLPYCLMAGSLILARSNPQNYQKIIRSLAVFACIYTLFPIGWNLRNAINVPPEAAHSSKRALSTMVHGTYPDFFYKTQKRRYYPYLEDPQYQKYRSSLKNFATIFRSRFKERPWRYISWYVFEKPYYLWSWNILQGQGDVYVYEIKTSLYQQSAFADLIRRAMRFAHPFILFETLGGMAILLAEWKKHSSSTESFLPPVTSLAAVCLYFTLLYTVFVSWPRYSIPLRPELYLLFAWVLTWAFQQWRVKKTPLTTR